MRDALYIFCLFAFFLLLAADFPSGLATSCTVPERQPVFASFVELPPSVHAACLESARTTWQVRNGSRSRPIIGSLDSGVPLLLDSLPPREGVVFADIEIPVMSTVPIDIGAYSLMPESEGADNPAFSTRPTRQDAAVPTEMFSRKDMLSVDNYGKIKEMIQ